MIHLVEIFTLFSLHVRLIYLKIYKCHKASELRRKMLFLLPVKMVTIPGLGGG